MSHLSLVIRHWLLVISHLLEHTNEKAQKTNDS